MKEVWKEIKGYEGFYQVSNIGNIKSLDRIVRSGRKLKGKELSQFTDKDGYLIVSLSKDGKAKHFRVHRLIALAFLENPLNLPEVNHKDENKTNNLVENLEWCTTEHNINHGTRNARVSLSLSGEKSWSHKLSKNQVDEIREARARFTLKELSNIYGVSIAQISRILAHKRWKNF